MISAQLINFQYSPHKKDLIIENLSLNIHKGEILALLGKSGAGKSTIASIMAGLRNDKLTGTILCNNEPLIQPDAKVALVLQDYRNAVFPWFSVERNIRLGFVKSECNGSSDNLMKEIADIMEFDKYMLNKNPSELSGGQQQKIQIARALAANCDFLILDEPSSSLDMEFRQDLLRLLVRLKKEKNIGIMLVTHNIEEAVFVSDNIVLCIKNSVSHIIDCSKNAIGYSSRTSNIAEAYNDKQFQEILKWVYQNIFTD